MVLASPLLTVDTTTTDGVGTYTLGDPASPGAGLRTLTDAVTDGHVSNGDTVEYLVEDTNTEGATLNFEHGVGTVGSAGASLTRDTIIQSSNSDAAVSWPVGGSRTVRIVLASTNVCRTANNLSDVLDADTAADNIGAARLNAANDWTVQRQEVRVGSAAGQVVGWAIANSAAGDVNNRTAFEHRSVNGSSTELAVAQERGRLTTLTAGSEDSELAWLVRDAGSLAVHLTLTKTGLADGSGNKYDAFPSGQRLMQFNNTLPSGWSLVSGLADRTVLTTSTLSEIDDLGGSWTISGLDVTGSTDGHALTVAQTAGHDHNFVYTTATFAVDLGGAAAVNQIATSGGGATTVTTQSTGSGSAHSHTLTAAGVSSTGAWRPLYVKGGIIEKA